MWTLCDMFLCVQGTRNTGKSIANRNTANPTAMLLASCLLLDHLRLHAYASMIRRAILSTVTETRVRLISFSWTANEKHISGECYMENILLTLFFLTVRHLLLFHSCTLLTWEGKVPRLKWCSPSWMQFRAPGPAHWAPRTNRTH